MSRDRQSGPLEFVAVIEAYIASDKFRKLAKNTQIAYEYIFRLAKQVGILGDIPVTELTPRRVQKFLDLYSDRPATMCRARAAIKSLETWALIREDDFGRPYLLTPIATGTEATHGEGSREPWTDAEIELAVRHAPQHLGRVVQLAAWTAQRLGDLTRMQTKHITAPDEDGMRWITVTQEKTALPLYVPIFPELEAILATWDCGLGYLLTRPTGGPWEAGELSKAWYTERERNESLASLRPRGLSFHGLRATGVIRLGQRGWTEREIAKAVGMSTKMVGRYSSKEEARELVRKANRRNRTGVEQNNVVSLSRKDKI